MTEDCEEFEIHIERRAHGALDAEQAPVLEAHLASCERCRAFDRLVRQVGTELRLRAEDAAKEVPWPAVEHRLQEQRQGLERAIWLVPAALLATAAATLALGLPPIGAGIMAAVALLTTAAAWRIRRQWQTELGRTLPNREGILAFFRRQIDADLRAARWGGLALACLAVVQFAGIEVMGRPSPVDQLGVALGSAVLLVTGLLLIARVAPRLRRERSELS